MWVPNLLLPPVKIMIFGPKRPNLVQNMLSLAHIRRLIWCPVVWLVGWWLSRVGCMSQDTYLLSSNIVLPNTFVKFFFLIYFPVFPSDVVLPPLLLL